MVYDTKYKICRLEISGKKIPTKKKRKDQIQKDLFIQNIAKASDHSFTEKLIECDLEWVHGLHGKAKQLPICLQEKNIITAYNFEFFMLTNFEKFKPTAHITCNQTDRQI